MRKKFSAKKAAGAGTSDLVKEYERPASTMRTIFKEKDTILSADVEKGVKNIRGRWEIIAHLDSRNK